MTSKKMLFAMLLAMLTTNISCGGRSSSSCTSSSRTNSSTCSSESSESSECEEDNFGWNKNSAKKKEVKANGSVTTGGNGFACATANEHGVMTYGKGTKGAETNSGYSAKESSWIDNNAFGKKGGKSWATTDQSSKKEVTKGKAHAYGNGDGEVNSWNGENGVRAHGKGNHGSGSKVAHEKKKDNWGKSSAWQKDECEGTSSAWNNQFTQKRHAKTDAESHAAGAGHAGSQANEQGSGGHAYGTGGAYLRAGSDIKDSSTTKSNAWKKKKGKKASAWNNATGSKTESQGCLESEGYGNSGLEGGTDHDNGVGFKGFGEKGTQTNFGHRRKEDSFTKQNAWGKKKRDTSSVCTSEESESESCEDDHNVGHGRRLGYRKPNYHKIINKLKAQLCECREKSAKKDKKIEHLQKKVKDTREQLWKCEENTKKLQCELNDLRKQNEWLKKKLHKLKKHRCPGWNVGSAGPSR